MLVLIDLQNDYFDPKGKFYFPETKEMIGPLSSRIQQAKAENEKILYTLNLYTDEDPRSKEDREWASALYEPFRELLKQEEPLTKLYYGISPPEAQKILQGAKSNPPKSIEFGGVETQLCVMANLIIVQNIFPEAEIIISRRFSRSSNPALEEKAFSVLKGMKIKVID